MMETLYAQAAKKSQSLEYVEYAEHAGQRWRARFKRDFYEKQSFGVAERWDGSQWREVLSCSPSRLKLGGHSTSQEVVYWEADAALDAEYLITMAAMVVGEGE